MTQTTAFSLAFANDDDPNATAAAIAITHITRQRAGDISSGYYYQTGESNNSGELDRKKTIWQDDLDRECWMGPYRTEKVARIYAETDVAMYRFFNVSDVYIGGKK